MSRTRLVIVTIGIMLSLFMASMESTVVATAMPTIVSQLGGLAIYSWVFSIYMLTSTTTVPVYGKLSDIFGRRPVYLFGMVLFLIGSILCGTAQSMGQLIAYRALQGIGAGGVLPMTFIIVGDIFSFEQRARMQGLFSGVWGVSSIVGPLLGGFLVDNVSWHWVFYVNVIPGVLATVMVWFALQDQIAERVQKPVIDYAGAILLSAAVVALLMGLFEEGSPLGWGLLSAAAMLFAGLIWVELRAADPILPLHLFRDRLYLTATGNGLMAGWAMFGSFSFVPLFVQAVLGTSATDAGATLAPLMFGWVGASIVGGRLLLRIGYRTVALIGMTMLTAGAFMMAQLNPDTTRGVVMVFLGMMGVGMGFAIPSFLIAVQSSVAKRDMGTATSTLQFSRSIGGTLGVSVMGALLSSRLAAALTAVGVDPTSVSLNSLIDPVAGSSTALDNSLHDALAVAMQGIFVVAFLAAALGLAITALAPGGNIAHIKANHPAEAGQPEVAPGMEM